MKVYRLLRNNKEQGPFSAEELIQKNLKPYDLIWVDGRSAAWRYPGEIAEFKIHVPPASEFINPQQPVSVISASVQAAAVINNSAIQPPIKQKPRYKVSAAWNKLQTVTAPAFGDVMVQPHYTAAQKTADTKQFSAQSKSLSWEDAWFDWEKEKKEVVPVIADIVKVKPEPQKKSVNEHYTAPALETKYAEPLDSLKDKYIENILLQKQRSKKRFSFGKASEFVIPSAALIVIFSIGYWLLHDTKTAAAFSTASVNTAQQAPANSNELPAANMTANNAAQTTPSENNYTEKSKNNIITSTKTPSKTDEAEERKTNYVHTAKLTPAKQVDDKQQNKFPATDIVLPGTQSATEKNNQPAKQFDASVINNVPADKAYNDPSNTNAGDLNAANARPTRRRTNAEDATLKESSQKNGLPVVKNNTKTGTKYINVPEYIEMKNGSANLNIQNVSDVDLDLVVVDVQYYDGSNRFRKGETLYLHNLRAGRNVIVKTPKDLNSMYATSKVSLVSSDAKNVYVIGDK